MIGGACMARSPFTCVSWTPAVEFTSGSAARAPLAKNEGILLLPSIDPSNGSDIHLGLPTAGRLEATDETRRRREELRCGDESSLGVPFTSELVAKGSSGTFA